MTCKEPNPLPSIMIVLLRTLIPPMLPLPTTVAQSSLQLHPLPSMAMLNSLLAILTLAFSENRDNARNIVVSVFLMVWAMRLSGFLLFRILKTGKDDRFDDKRDKFWSFLGFWVLYVMKGNGRA